MHIKNFKQVRIYSNKFLYNGPTLSTTEAEFSTYYKVMGSSTLLTNYQSYDNELLMIEQSLLYDTGTYDTFYLPMVMGALAIEHCYGTGHDCRLDDDASWYALVDILGNNFEGNFGSPVTRLEQQTEARADAIYLDGAWARVIIGDNDASYNSVLETQCTFAHHSGINSTWL